MSAPFTPDDFKALISSPTATLCGNFINTILRLPTKLYELVLHIFDDSGDVTEAFKRQIIPSGFLIPAANSTVPDGWLLCNGQEVSRTTYAELFAAIGIVYGAGNGTTTFLVPDLRARFPCGVGTFAGGGAATLGTAGGEDKVALSSAESGGDHVHVVGRFLTDSGQLGDNVSIVATNTDMDSESLSSRRVTGSDTYTSETLAAMAGKYSITGPAVNTDGSEISNAAHNNLPPYLPVNWMIKT